MTRTQTYSTTQGPELTRAEAAELRKATNSPAPRNAVPARRRVAVDYVHTVSAVTGQPVVFTPGESLPRWAWREGSAAQADR